MSEGRRRAAAIAGRCLVALGVLGCLGVAVIRYTGLQEFGFRMMGIAGASVAFAAVAAAVSLLGALAVLVSGAMAPRRMAPVLVAAFAPVAVLVHMTAPALEGVLAPERASGGTAFSVLTQNLYFRNAEPAATLHAVLERGADVLVLTEFTPDFERLLDRHPDAEEIERTYPHQWRRPETQGSGLAVLSTLPIDGVVPVPLSAPAVVVQLRVGGEQVDLYALHPMAPSDRWGLEKWQADYRTLTADAADADPRTVMAGDFNASTGHRAFRRLLQVGDLRDAQDVAGGGLAGTWPVLGSFPQLMRLDHVLVGRGIGVERVELLEPTGSDHRGVEAWLRVPRS